MTALYFPFWILHFSSFLSVCSRKRIELSFIVFFTLENLYNKNAAFFSSRTAFVAGQGNPWVGNKWVALQHDTQAQGKHLSHSHGKVKKTCCDFLGKNFPINKQ
jgi:hypothetical protein